MGAAPFDLHDNDSSIAGLAAARRRYDPGGRKLARAQARWKRIEARRRRVTDAIAGAPEAPAVAMDPILAGHERTTDELGGDE